MLRKIARIADKLDSLGMNKEADLLDDLIRKLAQESGLKTDFHEASSNHIAAFNKTLADALNKIADSKKANLTEDDKLDVHVSAERIKYSNKWNNDTDIAFALFCTKVGLPKIFDWRKYAIDHGYTPDISGATHFIKDNIRFATDESLMDFSLHANKD